ncbi:hypothetical protein JTP67_31210, partial [Streptomyces sp. S12]|nr:hypothetical protein [Streptomyces sp. S12]
MGGVGAVAADWLTEPSAAERMRRGGRFADGSPTPAPPPVAPLPLPAAAWLAEPSAAERVRRTGR